jgi:branched-chain amino acid transport system permease protein
VESCLADFQSQWSTALFNGLTVGCVYALIALGYSMVYGLLDLINFAHGDIFMIGSFAGLAVLGVTRVGEAATGLPLVLLLVLAAAVSMLVSGLAAIALEIVAYRPLRLRGAPRHAGMIAGMGASIVIEESVALILGRNNLPYPAIMPTTSVLTVGFGTFTNRMLLIVVTTIVMLLVLDWFVQRSRLGRGMRAVSQEPRAAVLMGVNISKVILLTFLIGGLAAGLGGFMYGLYYGKANYFLGFVPGIKGLSAAVLGGVGNMRGAMVGGLVIGLVENFGVICIPTQLKDVIAFSVLVLVLLFRPRGLLGARLAAR